MALDQPEVHDASSRQYRRGALLGMTIAEAFILIAFALLLLLAAWKTNAEKEISRYRDFATLTPEQVREVARLHDSGRLDEAVRLAESGHLEEAARLAESGRFQEAARLAGSDGFEAISELQRNGADFERLSEIASEQERWRFIDKDELRRILEGVQELPDDIQRDLADLVEIEDPRQLVRLLERTQRAEEEDEEDELRDRLAGIGEQLAAVRQAETDLIADLRRTLGDTVAAVGGYIDDSGAVVLQDSILFDVGSAELRPRTKELLDDMCVPWLEVMMRSRLAVAGAQIEGHASSEWSGETSPGDAYLNNLDLSQRRSAAVLRECLANVTSKEAGSDVGAWARAHLRAVGFSSARPVLDGAGAESPEQSRRVVFSLDLDRARVIEDLEDEIRSPTEQ